MCMSNILTWQNKYWQPYVCPYWFFLFHWTMKWKVLDQKCSRHRKSGFLLGICEAFHDALMAKIETGIGCGVCGGRVSWWWCFITCHPDDQGSQHSVLLVLTLQIPSYVAPNLPISTLYPILFLTLASFPILHLLFP